MTIDSAAGLLQSGIDVVVYASMPCIGIGLLIGLIIAIFQAVTQINEQTLTFVPKMIAVFIVLSLSFPWMSELCLNLCNSMWSNIPFYAR